MKEPYGRKTDTAPRAEFVFIGKVKPDVRWHNRQSVHEHHELIVVLSGILHITSGDRHVELRTGEAALYPAGVPHWEHSDENEPVESCFLVFRDPNFSGDKILVNKNQGNFLRPLASALYEQSISGGKCTFGHEILNLMLKIFAAPSSAEDKPSGLVRKVHAFMHRNLSGSLTLDDLAGSAGLSKYHFLRQYRLETGRTPIRDLWEMRCTEAVSLLKYTGLPIKEIALRTGFSDSAHFTRRIREFCGKLPRQLRES